MDALLKELQEAVAKELPRMQSDALARFITESNATKAAYEKLKADFDDLKKSHSIQSERIVKFQAMTLDRDLIDRNKEALRIEKLEFDVNKKLKDAEVEKHIAVASALKDVVKDVFRNTEIRRSIMTTAPVGSPQTGFSHMTSTQNSTEQQD